MSAALDVLKLLGIALDAGVADLESLGPTASTKIAQQLKALGYIDGATATAIESSSWIGWAGFGIGLLAVAALATPVGAASEAIGVAATSIAGAAIEELFAGTAFPLVGSFAASQVVAATQLMTAVATATINYFVAEGAAAITTLAAAAGNALGDFASKLLVAAPSLYNDTAVVTAIGIPTNVQTWDTPSGSIAYSLFTSGFSPTSIAINTQNNVQLGIVQGVITDGSNTTLIINYGGPTGNSSISIGGGTIDPATTAPPYVTQAADGSVVVGLPDSTNGNAVLVDYVSTGTVSIMVGEDGGATGQQLLSFSESDFNGDTIDVTDTATSTFGVTIDIGAGDTFEVYSDTGSAATPSFIFAGAGGMLKIDVPNSYTGTVSNFQSGDTIDLAGIGTVTAGTLTLADGPQFSLPASGTINIPAPAANSTPEQVLLDYLAALGDPMTAAQLDTAELNYQNSLEGGTADVLKFDEGISNGVDYVLYEFGGGGFLSPSITGATTYSSGGVTYPVYNAIDVNGIDFSNATLTNIQEFILNNTAGTTLTQAQFSGVSTFVAVSGAPIYGATSGTYDLNLFPDLDVSLVAQAWGGTTLIGNNQNGETLTASLFGSDTLQAGNGTGDVLVAGGGDDTITGGTGGDTFVVGNGTANGTVITGIGSGNVLQVGSDSDISGVTISGVQTLSFSHNLTLSAAELADFSTVTGSTTFTDTITAASAGTYSLQGKGISLINMVAGSNGGTTLIGNDAAGETLTASSAGNDTLIAGNGANEILDVNNSVGNNTLIGGTGGDSFEAEGTASGNDSMQGNGGNNFYYININGGTDTINNYHTDSGQSAIYLGNVQSSQAVATRSGNDLLIRSGSGSVIVQNFFVGSDYQVASIHFVDGVSWTPQNIPITTTPPTISAVTPASVEKGQTTIIGMVTPSVTGDTLTLTETAGAGMLSLGAVQAYGARQVVYTAPASISSSTPDAVSYTVSESDGATATAAASVQLDAGPSITPETPAAVAQGQAAVVGIVTPGLTGDALTLKETAGAGVLNLGTVQANGTQQVIYTAPASVPANTTDTISYTVSDQHNDVVATGAASVPLEATAPTSVARDPDGIGVLDSVTGIEWLPLTNTLGYSYSQVVGGGDPLVPQGYVLATDAQVLTLYKDAGFSPTSGVDGFVTASDVSDGGALFNSFAALFGKTNSTDNLTSGLSASPQFQIASGVVSGLASNVLYGPSSATFDHSDSVAAQTPDYVAIGTTAVTGQAEFMYKVLLPTLAGATFTLNNNTVTAAIGAGQTVGLDALVTAFSGLIPSLILQGPGTADITGPAIIPDLEVTSGASLVIQGGTVTTDPVTIDAGSNVIGYGTITGSETANGTITASSGTLDITGNVSGSGTLAITSGASLQLEGTIAATESVIFASGGNSLILGSSADMLAPVGGFGLGDSIALEGQQVASAVYNANTEVVAITSSTGTIFTLSLSGTYQQSNFAVTNGDVVWAAGTPPPAPTIAVPGTATVGIGQATPIGGISVAEASTTAGETFIAVLTDTNGLLSAATSATGGGGTITPSNGGTTLTITGTLAQLNADLTTLTDDDVSTAADTITVNVTDSNGRSATAAAVAVTVNGLPAIAASTSATVQQNQATAVPGVSIAETGNTATSGETFTAVLTDASGVLSATTTATGGGTVTASNGGTTLTISGTLAQLNADLTTLTDTDASTTADTIMVNAKDSFGNVATPKSIAVAVTPQSGAPSITAPAMATVGIGQTSPVGGISVAETPTTAGETFTTVLTDTSGVLSATTAATGGGGTITPSNGGKTLTIIGTLAQLNADLTTLTDDDASTAADTITVNVTDSNGGTATPASIAVTANSAQPDSGPSVELQPFVPGAVNKPVTVATATPGLPGDTLSLVLTQAPQSGTVALQGTSVQFTPTSNSTLLKPLTFSFDVKDQLGDTTSAYTVIVGGNLANDVTGNAAGNTDIGLGNGLNKITLAGSGNDVDAGNGANGISGGVSNNTLILGNGLNSVKLSGGDNTITLGNGADSVSVGGSGNQITLGNGLDVVHGGTGDTINLAKTTLALYGTDEMVFIGAGNATVTDFSTGLDLKIGPTAEVDVLAHFASDPSGVVDLIGGLGGFTITAAVLSALKSDGHGGTLLSFGHGSSLDFTGMAVSQLHGSNFKIG